MGEGLAGRDLGVGGRGQLRGVLNAIQAGALLTLGPAIPVGQLVYGPLAQVFDPSDVMLVSALAYVVIAFATLGSSSVRNLERAKVVETETLSPEPAGPG